VAGTTDVEEQRVVNLWRPLARKFPPIERAASLAPKPELDFEAIGGLAEAKEEILTYACAATHPEVYRRWGTVPPPGALLVGPAESGKSLLAEALAVRTDTAFLMIRVPSLVLEMLRAAGNPRELLESWDQTLAEMPGLTVFFSEVDFSHVEGLVGRHPNIPVAPVMDFVLELVDRTMRVESTLVVGSTSHPESISPAFLEPSRFERVISVQPLIPEDVVAALEIHASAAESRAGRPLFEPIDWAKAVQMNSEGSIGEWIRLLHAVLRRKARCDATQIDTASSVTTEDLIAELERSQRAASRLPVRAGAYL
jgi:SpoVK/Ycf46/Vps4 family AAA+-type ATPase